MAKNDVILIRNVAPEAFGGAETYQVKLADVLKRNGFEPVIISSSKKLFNSAKDAGIRVIKGPYLKQQNYSGWRNLLLPIYFLWQLRLYFWYRNVFRQIKPKVINIQSRDDWIAASVAGRRMGIRVLWTDHIDFRTWVLQNVDRPFKNIIGKIILGEARKIFKIIFISNCEKESFDKVTDKRFSNVEVIPNGVFDSFEKYRKVKCKYGVYCYIGRLIDYKGIRELIGAFKKVERECPRCRLDIYGEGPLDDWLNKITCDDKRIALKGFTNDPLRAMAESDVFVLPSYYEGASIALLEAMMMKKKIVVSNVDGNGEIIIDGKTGILCRARDKDDLAKALYVMRKDSKKSLRMASAAREDYLEKYDFDKIFKLRMFDLYS